MQVLTEQPTRVGMQMRSIKAPEGFKALHLHADMSLRNQVLAGPAGNAFHGRILCQASAVNQPLLSIAGRKHNYIAYDT